MNASWVVYVKEVRENLRDRRTLLSALVTGPLLGPLLFALLINYTISHERERADKPLSIPVIGAENAPNLVGTLKQLGLQVRPPIADPEESITDQREDVILRVPAAYGAQWTKGDVAEVEIIYDASRRESDAAASRLRDMVQRFGQREATLRLLVRGISPKVVAPLSAVDRDLSTAQSRSQVIFGMLPYLFVLSLFVGGMYLAIDTTAGERERQSLEPLFANPVTRTRILVGKLCATFTFATASLLISMSAFAVSSRALPLDQLGMVLAIGPRFFGCALFVMLPLVVLLGSLQTLVAAFAKSYREAQTYQSLLMLVPVIPSALFSVLPIKGQLWMYAIPLMGQQLTLMRLVRGEPLSALAVALCFTATLSAGLLMTAITARIYQSERLAISV